jgi:hypothetical protein
MSCATMGFPISTTSNSSRFCSSSKWPTSRRGHRSTSPRSIPKDYDWPSLLDVEGDALEIQYRHILETLGKERGMLGVIFHKAQNKI